MLKRARFLFQFPLVIYVYDRSKISYEELSLTEREAFNLSARSGSILMPSWIDWSAHETISFIAPGFFCILAASYLSWHTMRALLNLSCNQFKYPIVRSKRKTINYPKKFHQVAWAFQSLGTRHELSEQITWAFQSRFNSNLGFWLVIIKPIIVHRFWDTCPQKYCSKWKDKSLPIYLAVGHLFNSWENVIWDLAFFPQNGIFKANYQQKK